jgi:asparagine synthase (glutamine-hydrolysing)
MLSEDGRYVLIFNGEIYNFIELRAKLEQLGSCFHSDCDAEVLLEGYRHWGDDLWSLCNGMWALALWDRVEKTLLFSRDRFGVKPLYICQLPYGLAWASEIKAFQELIPLEIDPQALTDTLEDPLALEPTTRTLFYHVQRLQAGSWIKIFPDHSTQTHRWWHTLEHLPHPPSSPAMIVEEFRSLFLDACALRMRSDVPLGTALSGGLDSSSVLCSLFHLAPQPLLRRPSHWQRSFTICAPQSTHDEFVFAKQVIDHVRPEATFIEMTPLMWLEGIDKVLYAMDDLFDPPVAPWLLYREYRRQGIVISLDGHGADELLGGYHHHVAFAWKEALLPYPKFKELQHLWRCFQGLHAPSSDPLFPQLFKVALQGLLPKTHPFYQWVKRFYWRGTTRGQGWGRYRFLTRQPTPPLENASPLTGLNQLLYEDVHQRTLPTILRNFDRASMAHGVEIRAPFLDYRLVQYAFALDASYKIGPLGSKHILRAAMKGILPEAIRLRKSKIGFAAPLNQWLSKEVESYVWDIVTSHSFQTSSIWNGPQILQSLEHHRSLRAVWEYVLADRFQALYRPTVLASV